MNTIDNYTVRMKSYGYFQNITEVLNKYAEYEERKQAAAADGRKWTVGYLSRLQKELRETYGVAI